MVAAVNSIHDLHEGAKRVSFIINPYRFGGGAAPSYIIEENFEGTGAPSGWSSTGGTVDWDASTSGLGMQGSQCLSISGVSNYMYTLKSCSGDVHGYFLFRCTTSLTDREFFTYAQSGIADRFFIYLNPAGTWKIKHGSVESASSGSGAYNTTYHIWWQYQADTGGGNGVGRLWVSTDGTKPGSPTCEITSGNGTSSVNVISPRARSNDVTSITNYFDRVLVDDVEIGSNP